MNFPLFKQSLLALPVVLISTHPGTASAITLVDWSLAGTPGNQLSQPASTAVLNITGGSITRGSGLGLATTTGTFSSNGWENAASGASGDEYLSFGFSIDAGYSVNLDHLYLGTRSSASGPGMLGLFHNGDGFTASLFTFNQAGTPNGTGDLYSEIDLGSLTGLTGNVEFRIYEIGNTQADGVGDTSSAGTFRLSDYFVSGVFNRSMQITGNVTAVPEAETFAMMLAGLGFVGWRMRRRRH